MQQRTMGLSRGPDRDNSFIDVEAQLEKKNGRMEAKAGQSSWRRRMEDMDLHGLPISNHDPHNVGNRETAKSLFAENWLHAIPPFVLLCFFILWWFSYPVHLVIKDESVAAIHWIEISGELNETRVDLALLASASSPGAGAWSFQKFTRTDVIEAPNTNQSGFGDQQQKSQGLTNRVEISLGFNDTLYTLIDPALPAWAALPRALNLQNFTRANETEAPKANQRYLL